MPSLGPVSALLHRSAVSQVFSSNSVFHFKILFGMLAVFYITDLEFDYSEAASARLPSDNNKPGGVYTNHVEIFHAV